MDKKMKKGSLKKLAALLCILLMLITVGGTAFAAVTEAPDGQKTVQEAENDTGSGETEAEGDTACHSGELSCQGSDYTVKISYDADAQIPEGASLRAEEIQRDSEKYESCLKRSGTALRKEGLANGSRENVEARFFDITILYGDREIEPAGPVSVEIGCREALPVADDGEVNAVHFEESGAEVLETDTGEKNGEVSSVSFDTESFSVFGIVYTVDFSYAVDGRTYEGSMPGGGYAELKELTVLLGIVQAEAAEQFAADIESVEFSSPDLVWTGRAGKDTTVGELKQENGLEPEYSADLKEEQIRENDAATVQAGSWILISLRPFESEETLTVTMKTGEVFRIRITDAQIRKAVMTAEGESYEITVTYDDAAEIPEGAELEAAELTGSAYEDYLERAAAAMHTSGFDYARIFDISIRSSSGEKIQPAGPVEVSVRLLDGTVSEKDFSVVHFSGEEEKPEEMDAESEDGTVSFSTESFSAYAIVEGPAEAASDWEKVTSLTSLNSLTGTGLYIGTTSGYYLTNSTGSTGTGSNVTNGIIKTKPAQDFPPENASAYYFEAVSGTEDQFYIYCLDGSGTKQYVRNTGSQDLTLTASDNDRTAFTADVNSKGQFRFSNGDRYWNMWHAANGTLIAAYDKATDGNNYFYVWQQQTMKDDPYSLDGKSWGLMNWTEGTTGKALMASFAEGCLEGLPMTVMAKTDHSSTLFVPDNSDISMWTFHSVGRDFYYLTAEVDGSQKYLKITSDGLSLVDTPDSDCRIRVLPGSGEHQGEICLLGGDTALTYSGNISTGFSVGGSTGSEWLHLTEISELTEDYFMTYTASKVSVSDPGVTNGSRIIVYTRVWNDTTKKYEFYAIDHDGSLVRCYENGDSIEWTGGRLNSMLWNFVEYYSGETGEPNYYYELYNQYSEKYIAPQSGDQILSVDTIGINLSGRKNGRYYTPILAWDDSSYAYAGLKVEDGKIVSCPKSEAEDFYFAVVQDIPVDDELTTVPTIDNTQHGITMKMINFSDRNTMSSFLGSDNVYKNGNTENGLLSTELGEDGYPVTKADNSLSDWFADAGEVNHLFIASTYSGSGYYEYDSTQNFAHLDTETGNFTVYGEIGTTDTAKGKFYTHGQFFPYNDLTAGTFSTQKNLTDPLGNTLPDSDPRKYEQLYHITDPNKPDYYMGMEVEATFTQTPNGLDDWGHDIIYEFTGDDDFWLYVDGELVIDLGGIHDALPGSVNYRTGEVVVNGTHTTLRDLFYQNYMGRGHTAEEAEAYVDGIFEQNSEGNYVFRDYSTHTMKIFYLERGAGASNLHMHFNLASVRPGTVQLKKELSGVDTTESVLAEFPYQIRYRTETGGSQEFRLTNSIPGTTQTDDYVFYKGSANPVRYQKSLTVGGIEYQDVFLLKPEEVAEITFPDGMTEYEIIECGVNTEVYSSVTANGSEIDGTSGEGYPENRKDYSTGYAATDDRARVVYENHVRAEALKTLTITKKLYKEDGETEISADQDAAAFTFRLYLGSEFGDLEAADMHTYHVKDPDGNYCRWDKTQQKLVSTGTKDYSTLSDQEKEAVSFPTSMYGTISKIPAGYTVEVRDILASTRFQVLERPSEIPDGYAFQKYVYTGENYTGNTTDAESGVTDTVTAGQNPHVDICNLRGWGLRVNKVWTDADYMVDRDPVYFAVYTDTGNDLKLLEGSVRQMPYGKTTLYWYFLPLPVDVPFDRYEIREVTISNGDPTVDDSGAVSDPGTVTAVDHEGTVAVKGKQKGEEAPSEFSYCVTYSKGSTEEGSNVRTDTVTNDRSGLVLQKQDWSGKPLAGAEFTLKDENGTLIGTFKSDSTGLITTAFLRDNVEYTLTETSTPQGYHGLDAPLTIVQEEGKVTVRGEEQDSDSWVLEQAEGKTPKLTLKNRTFTFHAVKHDGDTGKPMQNVTFALYRQRTVDGAVAFDPVSGYENLTTDADGSIPKIDQTLPAGTYELRETKTPDGYQALTSHNRFAIDAAGRITLHDTCHSYGAELTAAVQDESGNLSCTLTIRNYPEKKVSVWKTDQEHNTITTGAGFALYRAADYDDSAEKAKSGTEAIVTGSTGENGLLDLGQLGKGEYRLIETSPPAGCSPAASAIRITVTEEQVTAMQAGNQAEVSRDAEGNSYRQYWIEGQDPDTWQIRVWNSTGSALPVTGGTGSAFIYMTGALVLLLAGAFLLIHRIRKQQ